MSILDDANSQERKDAPIWSGFMRYFPDAMVEVARLSKFGNDKHNPGEPLHWAKEKSTDHDDCVARHLLQAGTRSASDGNHRHRTMMAWRALAALQTEIEAERVPVPRTSINPNIAEGVLIERRTGPVCRRKVNDREASTRRDEYYGRNSETGRRATDQSWDSLPRV